MVKKKHLRAHYLRNLMNSELYTSEKSLKVLDYALSDSNLHALMINVLKGTKQVNVINHILNKLNLKEHSVKDIAPEKGSIGIDKVRAIKLEMSLKNSTEKKLLVIYNSELLTHEAQNALLKILEEPTPNLLIILLTENIDSLLPTVQSRCQIIEISKPSKSQFKQLLIEKGYKISEIDKALAISGGLPDLTLSILNNESTNLTENLEYSKALLKYPLISRLKEVDTLSKNKEQLADVLHAMELIASSGSKASITKIGQLDKNWQRILTAVLDAKTNLSHNVNTRLVLTKLMLDIR